MILDGVPFKEIITDSDVKGRSLRAFTEYLEKKLNVSIVSDLSTTPYGRPELQKPYELGMLLKAHNVIKEFGVSRRYPDMPPIKAWYAICNDPTSHQSGGASWESDEAALYAALAEGLERHIWMTQYDYFKKPVKATTKDIGRHGRYVGPENIVGYSKEQRTQNPARKIGPDTAFLWTQGTSLLNGEKVYMPAQVVSGMWRRGGPISNEPAIRQPITNGLATWPTQSGARLAGALEVIERESYMMLWFNQLTLPQLSIDSLIPKFPSLSAIFEMCERFRFKPHIIPLPTDAPTHVIAVVIEDLSGSAPRFAVGLKAHNSLPHSITKALTEAFRGYQSHRFWARGENVWDPATPVENIGHRDRLYYWGVPENAKHLEFMIRGPKIAVEDKAWENDTIDQHYQRVMQWCKKENIECVSFPLTSSAQNPTQLQIEMVVMPQLQPTHLNETSQHLGGTRWRDVPKALGYKTLEKPFSARPHPFS